MLYPQPNVWIRHWYRHWYRHPNTVMLYYVCYASTQMKFVNKMHPYAPYKKSQQIVSLLYRECMRTMYERYLVE